MLPAIALAILLVAQPAPTPAPAPEPQQTSGTPTPAHQEAPVTLAPGQTPASLPPGQPYYASNGTVVYKGGPLMTPPRLIHRADPYYPKDVRKHGLAGTSRVDLIVDAEGNPQNVHIVRSFAETTKPKYLDAAKELDEQAVEAVKQYRFAPATLNSHPVAVELNVEINFKIF